MTRALELGPGAEFDAIRALVERWGPRATGIGDDAAVLRIARGEALVASVDSFVEGQHFKRDWMSPREIGYKAVVAALSDLAAMAATPLGVLVAFTVPHSWRSVLLDLADGIGDAVELAGAHVVGGNLIDGGELSITTTVLGCAFAPLPRAGARAGDGVYVTGELGGPASAVERLANGRPADAFRERFVKPAPRLAEARWLAEQGAHAAIDISDGLVADLRHIAAASNVSIQIDAAAVPCLRGVAVEVALTGGEEYELVVTSPLDFDRDEFTRRFNVPLTKVGVVGAAGTGVTVRGARVADAPGYDHFST